MKELGVIDKKAVPHPVINEIMGGKSYVQWEQMNDEQREKSARAMETYAGMITSIDRNVGKVLEYLEKIGVADSTSQERQRLTSKLRHLRVLLF